MGEQRRGRLTSTPERQNIIRLIQTANSAGARLEKACIEACISLRTYRRWFCAGKLCDDMRPRVLRPAPMNKLRSEERQQILEICNQPEFSNLPPSQIVPTLLDRGKYIASESTFYRILKENNQLCNRGRSQKKKAHRKPKGYTALGPNQIWSWDVTYLPSRVKGRFYYLYMFEDIFSRKIVGYEVHERECGELASKLIQRCVLKEKCFRKPLVLHSDNGAPMKSFTMKAKLEELGIIPSFNRPRVSNDNPYSESLFRTLKYCPQWPSSGFCEISDARNWVQKFVNWYNYKHKHSKIKFVTPAERHAGNDALILRKRKQVLEEAKAKTPERWGGNTRDCEPIGAVSLNPEKSLASDLSKAA